MPISNIICTLWNVMWPFEYLIFKRRVNIYLIKKIIPNKDVVADWNLYELIMFNIF
jgi:hypothetical protein